MQDVQNAFVYMRLFGDFISVILWNLKNMKRNKKQLGRLILLTVNE